jgi:hypothetical protein
MVQMVGHIGSVWGSPAHAPLFEQGHSCASSISGSLNFRLDLPLFLNACEPPREAERVLGIRKNRVTPSPQAAPI